MIFNIYCMFERLTLLALCTRVVLAFDSSLVYIVVSSVALVVIV